MGNSGSGQSINGYKCCFGWSAGVEKDATEIVGWRERYDGSGRARSWESMARMG